MTWKKLDVTGAMPEPRYEHVAKIVTRRGRRVMLVMLGASAESPLNDVWALDLGSPCFCYHRHK